MARPGYINQRHPDAKAGDLRVLFRFRPRTLKFFDYASRAVGCALRRIMGNAVPQRGTGTNTGLSPVNRSVSSDPC